MAKEDIIEHQFDKRTASEQQEIARQGGKASGRSRRRKRQFRDELEMLLPLTDKGKDGQPIINPLTGRKQTVQQSITMQLLLKARKGDVKAAKLILDTLGELVIKEEHKHEIEGGMVIVTADEMEKDALKKMKDED
ncbi:MAG: hypothetical protein IIZ44_07890 [Muribaculaceae bacterium]|nr:hypothetical protein [Muribaculaceae bacterium]